jgi:hypothetical protein
LLVQVVHLDFRRDPSGFWSVTSPDLPDGSALAAGDWDLDEARHHAREAVAFALDVDHLPAHVRIVERLPGRRQAR